MNIHTPNIDDATKLQLVIIEIDEFEKKFSEIERVFADLSSRLKKIEDSFGGLSISEIAHEIKDCETRLKALEDLKLVQELQIISEDIKELKKKEKSGLSEKIKKIIKK